MKKCIALLSILFPVCLFSQSIGIGTTSPDASAQLEVSSTSKGFLLPRMTTAQRTTILSPANGLLVYDTDTKTFWYRDVAVWKEIGNSSSSNGWSISGNSGINPATNFLGTTDNNPLVFKLNNFYSGKLDRSNFNYFIGSGAGEQITSGIRNVALGNGAMSLTGGNIDRNIAIGDSAMSHAKRGTIDHPLWNIAIGSKALKKSEGPWNIAMGYEALSENTEGYMNIGIGYGAMGANITGSNNIAIGPRAKSGNSGGEYNIAIGQYALYLTDSSFNIGIGDKALYSNNTGTKNIAIGNGAMVNTQNNLNENVAIGDSAMAFAQRYNGTTDIQNVAVGYNALKRTRGYWNTAVGYNAMMSTTTGITNTAIGSQALRSNTAGNNNNAFGYAALYDNIDGSNNIAFGSNALSTNLGGTSNIAIGTSALLNNKNSYNVAIGNGAMLTNTEGARNVAIGNGVMRFAENDMTGNVAIGDSAMAFAQNDVESNTSLSVAIGLKALKNNQGNRNSAIGYNAMEFNTTGDKNTAIGYKAMETNTDGIDNVSIGAFALNNNISGNANVAVGYAALSSNTSNYNVAIGHSALQTNTIGTRNVAIGNDAMSQAEHNMRDHIAIGDSSMAYAQFSGSSASIGVGTNTLKKNEGISNTAFGHYALSNNTSGFKNNAIGAYALSSNTFGAANNVLGNQALQSNVDGSDNIAIGDNALFSNLDGSSNVALGREALNSNRNSSNNVALGSLTLSNNKGSNNTAVGYQSGNGNTVGSGNVFIGHRAGYNARSSNKLYIENDFASDSLDALVYGEFDNDKLRFNASTFITKDLSLKKNTIAALAASPAVNIVNPGNSSFIEVSSTGNFIIDGVLDASGDNTIKPPDGKILTIFNNSTFNMSILQESVQASAINRIRTLTGGHIITTGTGSVTLQYAVGIDKWIVIATQL